jgi:hypothetical protein
MRLKLLPRGSFASEMLVGYGLQGPGLHAALEVTETPTPRRGGREVIIFFDGDELIVEHINVRVIHESAG